MGRTFYPDRPYIDAASMAAHIYGAWVSIEDALLIAFAAKWTGGTGAITIEATSDPEIANAASSTTAIGSAGVETVHTATGTPAGSSGKTSEQCADYVGHRWARMVYSRASGGTSDTLTGYLVAK